ncbi:hypothetical protein ACQEVG_14365 [Streptomyces sp. CA-135486]|uniref:hypothetical protein n=1 Tax=Streptomyces sp. CA-135486 TaxID=3240049 RepID=UPI003D8A4EC7
MNVPRKLPGRLQGGLSRIRDRLHFFRFLRNNGNRIAWAFAEAAIGAGVGVLAIAAYFEYR